MLQAYLDRKEVLTNELKDKSLQTFTEETREKVLNIINRSIVLYTEMLEDIEFNHEELFPNLESYIEHLKEVKEKVANFKQGDKIDVIM